MSKFLKLKFVKENFDIFEDQKTGELKPVSDGYEYVEVYFNPNLIHYFYEDESVPLDHSERGGETLRGSLLFLSKEGIQAVNDICDRLYDLGDTHNVCSSLDGDMVQVANTPDDICNQLKCVYEGK